MRDNERKMKIEEIENIFEKEHSHHLRYEGVCHDCEKEVVVSIDVEDDGRIVITGGAIYNPQFGTPPIEHILLKCDKCFAKDNRLRNFEPCSVYSRVVGYLRPISGWNPGKQEEWKMRKNFKI